METVDGIRWKQIRKDPCSLGSDELCALDHVGQTRPSKQSGKWEEGMCVGGGGGIGEGVKYRGIGSLHCRAVDTSALCYKYWTISM